MNLNDFSTFEEYISRLEGRKEEGFENQNRSSQQRKKASTSYDRREKMKHSQP